MEATLGTFALPRVLSESPESNPTRPSNPVPSASFLRSQYVGWFSTGANMLKHDLEHAPDQLSRLHDDVDKYGNAWRKTFIWGLLGAVVIAGITEITIVACQHCRRMSCALSTIAVPLTMLMAIATALIAAVTMTSTMVVADYCIEPSANMLSVIPQPSMQYNVSRYYITCTGVSMCGTCIKPLSRRQRSYDPPPNRRIIRWTIPTTKQ